jgi:hypothetical protein
MNLEWITNEPEDPTNGRTPWQQRRPRGRTPIKGKPRGNETLTGAEIETYGYFGVYVDMDETPRDTTP